MADVAVDAAAAGLRATAPASESRPAGRADDAERRGRWRLHRFPTQTRRRRRKNRGTPREAAPRGWGFSLIFLPEACPWVLFSYQFPFNTKCISFAHDATPFPLNLSFPEVRESAKFFWWYTLVLVYRRVFFYLSANFYVSLGFQVFWGVLKYSGLTRMNCISFDSSDLVGWWYESLISPPNCLGKLSKVYWLLALRELCEMKWIILQLDATIKGSEGRRIFSPNLFHFGP